MINGTTQLQLCDVNIFEDETEDKPLIGTKNLLLNKSARQSSNYMNEVGAAGKATDGNKQCNWNFGNPAANSVTHTNADKNAWWVADLGDRTNIA